MIRVGLQSLERGLSLFQEMSDASETTKTLNIRCPVCRQRFSVAANLMNRMCECGACDTRFRINDDVIVRTKKNYLEERKTPDLNRFQRTPLSVEIPEGLQTIQYAEFKNPELLEPISPQRVIAGIFGIGTMMFTALLFVLSSGPSSSISVMPLEHKLIIAGFVSALGAPLLIYANPKARVKVALLWLLLAAGLMSLPFYHKSSPSPTALETPDSTDPAEPLLPVEKKPDSLSTLKERYSTKPLEAEQALHEDSGTGKKAYGIYLTNLLQRNIYTIRDYLIRDTRADPTSHPYPRDKGDYLMVLTDVSMSIEEVAEIAGRLGETKQIHPEIGVIVIRVNNEQFAAGSADQLNDSSHPDFYKLNERELVSLDIDRVKRAVGRLAASEPKIYRTDISRSLTELMAKPGINFHDEISRALLIWAEDAGPAARAGLQVLHQVIAAGEPVPESLVELMAKGNIQEAIPSVHTLWMANPAAWDNQYAKFGSAIAPGVLEQINSDSAPLRHSALKLLGMVGSDSSIPILQKLAASTDPETRVLAERAIEKISER